MKDKLFEKTKQAVEDAKRKQDSEKRLGCLLAAACLIGSLAVTALIIWALITYIRTADAGLEEHPVKLKTDVKADLTAAEGRSQTVYVLRGILHGGIGHRLTNADLAHYHAGDVIPNETIEQWWDIDYARCMKAIKHHLPDYEDYPRLAQLAVFNWCYQLGTGCFEEFPRATKALQKRQWSTAAAEWGFSNIRTRHWSKWRKQTQHRCEQEMERLQEVSHREMLIEFTEKD